MPVLELIAPMGSRVKPKFSLSPTQRKAAEGILLGLERGNFAVLQDYGSDGKTTVLEHIHRESGGVMIGVREFLTKLGDFDPIAVEEAFLHLIDSKLDETDLLIVDDFHLVKAIAEDSECTRSGVLDAALTAILSEAAAAGKKMVFATMYMPEVLSHRAHAWAIQDLTAEDFRVICSSYLDPAAVRRLDFAEIYRFAPSLNAHQLRKAAVWLSHEPGVETARFLEYLSAHNLVSNVAIEEVEPVTWNDLKGVDDVIQALEAKVALPFENREMAAELGLKPKRGVLLAGPPGTGKTTIGRALAHRLKGKFFLVDGTMIAGSNNFYAEINRVFAAAKRNAPSVIFIDDADVIFADEKESGLYRYLLTKLDGLESASAGRVCVMMTAMEPSDLPAALLRSGRVELWLETRLPDAEARAEIVREKLAGLPPPFDVVDTAKLAAVTRGFTGADLKSAIEDGKLLYAHDRASGNVRWRVVDYFLEAIAAIRQNRRKYAKRKRTQLTDAQPIGFRAD